MPKEVDIDIFPERAGQELASKHSFSVDLRLGKSDKNVNRPRLFRKKEHIELWESHSYTIHINFNYTVPPRCTAFVVMNKKVYAEKELTTRDSKIHFDLRKTNSTMVDNLTNMHNHLTEVSEAKRKGRKIFVHVVLRSDVWPEGIQRKLGPYHLYARKQMTTEKKEEASSHDLDQLLIENTPETTLPRTEGYKMDNISGPEILYSTQSSQHTFPPTKASTFDNEETISQDAHHITKDGAHKESFSSEAWHKNDNVVGRSMYYSTSSSQEIAPLSPTRNFDDFEDNPLPSALISPPNLFDQYLPDRFPSANDLSEMF